MLADESNQNHPANRLAQEQSLYLLQHAHNPVHWYPWGEEAFAKARAEQKPILLSIGYSTCHWCHVMERESFQDQKTADYLNEHFVAIKLDREERPDLDAVYMKSFQTMMGQGGGWPLNVFLTGELELFYGGTYFPPQSSQGRPSFRQVLEGVERAWRESRKELQASAERLKAHLQTTPPSQTPEKSELSQKDIKNATSILTDRMEPRDGGWGIGPKFPQPSHLMLLLTSNDKAARDKALFTCRKMADGGIHDRLAGGFHRYAVDGKWLVPHFEKMLYDQAQLLEVYCEASRLSSEPVFAKTAQGIADYIIKEMQHPDGAYYSAQDAQSEGKEGKYWCWTTSELEKLLSPAERVIVERIFGLSEKGNFYDFSDPEALTHQNVLSIIEQPTAQENELFTQALHKMRKARSQRTPPMTDDKILAGWNGLMIAAMAEASRVYNKPHYLESAKKAFTDVTAKLWDGQRLANRWRGGHIEESQQALNYLTMARAGRKLYSTTLKKSYLTQGLLYLDGARERFFDSDKGGFYDSEQRPDLVVRLKDTYDSAIPTPSSIGSQELLFFTEITGRQDLSIDLKLTFQHFRSTFQEEPFSLPGMLLSLNLWLNKPARLVLIGNEEELQEFLNLAWQNRGQDLIIMSNSGPVSKFTKTLKSPIGTTAYFCEAMTCREPTDDLNKISAWLRQEELDTNANE